jgi:hypothetical protein
MEKILFDPRRAAGGRKEHLKPSSSIACNLKHRSIITQQHLR